MVKNIMALRMWVAIAENIRDLSTNTDTMDIIKTVDNIYNTYIDRSFERKHGTLADVLAIRMSNYLRMKSHRLRMNCMANTLGSAFRTIVSTNLKFSA